MNPLLLVLLLLIGVPLLELYVLIEVGSAIGSIAAISLSVFTAVLGALLVRAQGPGVLVRIRQSVANRQAIAGELAEAAVLALGGLLLLLPGFVTDFVGFLCLIPIVRRRVALAWMQRAGTPFSGDRQQAKGSVGRPVIEGEFRRED